MTKYIKTNVASVTGVNSELDKIETAIDSHLDRAGGSPNYMEADLDMNSNDILNAGNVATDTLSLAGQQVFVDDLVTSSILPTQTGHAGEHLTTDGSIASWTAQHGEIDLADYVTTPATASAEINTAAAAALAAGKALVSYDRSITYVLTAGVPIDLEGLKYIDIKGEIDTTALDTVTTTGVIRLGNMAQSTGGDWRFGDIISSNPLGLDTATTYPQVRINGTKSITMHFGETRYIQFYQTDEVTDATKERIANAYNHIYIAGRTGLFEVTGTTRVTDPVWFNENRIYGGRIYKTIFRDKGYNHNHNHFYNSLFEGTEFEVDLETGHSNHWHDVRLESVTLSAGITFAAGTSNNTVERSWISSLTPRETVQNMAGFPITDTGKNNSIYYKWLPNYTKKSVISFSPNQTILTDGLLFTNSSSSTVVGVLDNEILQTITTNARRPVISCRDTVVVPFTHSRLAETGLIPVDNGAIFSVEGIIDSGFWRYQMRAYDSDGLLLDDAGAFDAPSLTYSGSGVWASSDLTSSELATNRPLAFNVDSASVAYVSAILATGSVSDTVIRAMNMYYYEPANSNTKTVASLDRIPKSLYLDSEPLYGHASLGQKVGTLTGEFACAFELTTYVTTEISAGATSITVDDITNTLPAGSLADGDVVGISLDDGTTHWDVVSGLASKTFTISALVSPIGTAGVKALAGAYVVFNRWIRYEHYDETGKNYAGGLHAMQDSATAPTGSVALGHGAGRRIEGDKNICIGKFSAPDVTGDNNTIVGADCGLDLTSGTNNVLIGYLCEPSAGTAANQIAIGINVGATADDQFSFGSFNNVVSNDFGTDALWSRASDVRKKTNIVDSVFGLDFITQLRPVEFNWKEGWGNTTVDITGLIAQDVEAALDGREFIGHAVRPDGYQTLKLEAFIPVLINAVKELTAKVEKLENK